MARRESYYTVPPSEKLPKNRDEGKTFKIIEMIAWDAEDWAFRVVLALVKAGAELPDGLKEKFDANEVSMADMALLGINALKGLLYHDAKPLLDDMMKCVHIIPDKKNAHITREIIQDDVEEVSTIVELRKQVMSLHLNFSSTDDTQNTAT